MYDSQMVRVYSLGLDCTHQGFEFGRVVWEAAVVDVCLGGCYPKECVRDQNANLEGT
jgi:hypothetical protein